MAKTQTLFLLLLSFSLGVLALESETIHSHPYLLSPTLAPTHPPAHPPHHHYPPTPANSPTHHHHHAPAKSPTHSHPPAPSHPDPIGSFIAVEGYVLRMSCKYYPDGHPFSGSIPINEAVVKLECSDTKRPLILQTMTTDDGHFLIKVRRSVTAANKCKVFLVSAQKGMHPTNIHGGIKGAPLMSKHRILHGEINYSLYNVRDLLFTPSCDEL